MMKRFRKWRMAAGVLGLAVALLVPGVALAAPSVHGGQADIEVDPGGTRVRLQYVVQNDDPAVTAVRLSLLRAHDTSVRDLVISAGGEPLTVEMSERGPAMTVQVPLPAAAAGGESFEFTAEYVVDGAVSGSGDMQEVVVPILAPTWTPVAQNDLFQATVRLPSGVTFVEGFPVAPASVEESGGASVVQYRNPVVPAMIRAVVSQGPAPFFTFQRGMDLLVVLVLVVGAYAAYRAITASRQPAGQTLH